MCHGCSRRYRHRTHPRRIYLPRIHPRRIHHQRIRHQRIYHQSIFHRHIYHRRIHSNLVHHRYESLRRYQQHQIDGQMSRNGRRGTVLFWFPFKGVKFERFQKCKLDGSSEYDLPVPQM